MDRTSRTRLTWSFATDIKPNSNGPLRNGQDPGADRESAEQEGLEAEVADLGGLSSHTGTHLDGSVYEPLRATLIRLLLLISCLQARGH